MVCAMVSTTPRIASGFYVALRLAAAVGRRQVYEESTGWSDRPSVRQTLTEKLQRVLAAIPRRIGLGLDQASRQMLGQLIIIEAKRTQVAEAVVMQERLAS